MPVQMNNTSTVVLGDSMISSNSSFSTPLGITFTVIPVVIIIFIIVIGNGLVVVAVLTHDRLKRLTQNWLIVSLAIADLLVGLLVMPFTLAYEILNVWLFGRAFCEIWLALDVLFVTASILNLCAISIDRYLSLVRPVHYSSTMSTSKARIRIWMMIGCSWLLAFVISLPPLVGWRPPHENDRSGHGCNLSSDVGYVLYSAFGSFFLPLAVVLFIYVRIFILTKQRISEQMRKAKERQNVLLPNRLILKNKRIDDQSIALLSMECTPIDNDKKEMVQKTSTESQRSCDGDCMVNNVTVPNRGRVNICAPTILLRPLELRMRLMQEKKAVRRRERQATVVLGFILGAFLISWLPFFCSYVLSAVCCQTPELVFDIVFWLGYCNSGLNPFIYTVFNRDFRSAFRHILCRLFSYVKISGGSNKNGNNIR